MDFEWNEDKNRVNIRKHRLYFDDAYKVFQRPILTRVDTRAEYGEERWIGLGLLGNRVVVIVFTEPEPDTIRVISLRKATPNERKRYEQAYKNKFE